MRAVVQRIREASVLVDSEVVGAVGYGLLVYAAAAPDDGNADIAYLADKVAHLRVFPDADGRMNLSVIDCGGSVLLVSAFTVLADARRGRRPSLDASASPEVAAPLIERLAAALREAGLTVATGRFAADMRVSSVNDGPICVLLDSRRLL